MNESKPVNLSEQEFLSKDGYRAEARRFRILGRVCAVASLASGIVTLSAAELQLQQNLDNGDAAGLFIGTLITVYTGITSNNSFAESRYNDTVAANLEAQQATK